MPLSPFPARGLSSVSEESLEGTLTDVDVGLGRRPPLANAMGGLNMDGQRFCRGGHMMRGGIDALCSKGWRVPTKRYCREVPDRTRWI